MIAAIASLMLAAGEPKVSTANEVKPAAHKPVNRPDPCARLDAAANPACANRLPTEQQQPSPPPPPPPPRAANAPRAVNTPAPAANAPAPMANAPVGPAPAAAKPQQKPPKVATKATNAPVMTKASGPMDKAAALFREQPILIGGASGLAVLLVIGVTVVGITRSGRRVETNRAPPEGSPPTRWRRDLVLTDQDGRDWRIDGAHLTPSAVVGSDPSSDLRRGDAGIAPRHAEFWVRDGRLMLRRLADPVFLNDRLLTDITPERVSTGDQLRLGSTTFTITIE